MVRFEVKIEFRKLFEISNNENTSTDLYYVESVSFIGTKIFWLLYDTSENLRSKSYLILLDAYVLRGARTRGEWLGSVGPPTVATQISFNSKR